jgi:hypothetical protein
MITADEVLADPAASDWLKRSLLSALKRDPVAAVNDAEASLLVGRWAPRSNVRTGISAILSPSTGRARSDKTTTRSEPICLRRGKVEPWQRVIG